MNFKKAAAPIYITVEEFTNAADLYFLRAQSGENIVVTIGGEPKYHLSIETTAAEIVRSVRPRLCVD